jgi:hypothetical protein
VPDGIADQASRLTLSARERPFIALANCTLLTITSLEGFEYGASDQCLHRSAMCLFVRE